MPRSAEIGAVKLAPETIEFAPNCNEADGTKEMPSDRRRDAKSFAEGPRSVNSREYAPVCNDQTGVLSEAREEGLEPPTLGSEDRCSIH